MYSLLLAIIYLAFISLGLPDSLVGAAWPVMRAELNVPVSAMGIITVIISCGTIVSSLLSDRITKKLGAGLTTAVSVAMTAAALLGFSFSDAFWKLCLWAIPYGLGAGAVDAALNNYVALHYSARHMSWLHCFWGVGAAASPYIMGFALSGGLGWQSGYRTVFYIQAALSVILFISLPLWKNRKTAQTKEAETLVPAAKNPLKIKGVLPTLAAFFAYCALEQTAGIWASSYLVQFRNVPEETAARFASLFYIGITAGRAAGGIFADKIGEKKLIRCGICVIGAGIVLIGLPFDIEFLPVSGLVVVGLGCAPVYPSVIHMTPTNFGKENSQSVIGIQMASAYIGTTCMPPLFGIIAQYVHIGLYPLYLLVFAVLMLFMTELVNRIMAKKSISA